MTDRAPGEPGHLARSRAPFVLEVERGKAIEIARATYAGTDALLRQERPVVPPTYLTTAALWRDPDDDPWRSLDLDPARTVHAEQEFEFFGPPPRVGARLSCTWMISDRYEKPSQSGGTLRFAVITTEFRDLDGELVVVSRTTAVETPARAAPR